MSPFLLLIRMSQAGPTDTDPIADTPPPHLQPPHTELNPPLDTLTDLPPPSAPLQPPLVPEGSEGPESTNELLGEDVAGGDSSEGPTDRPEHGVEGHLSECDQSVSLELDTETAEVEVEVKLSGVCCV